MNRESGIGAAIRELLNGGSLENILSNALEEKSASFPFGLPKGVELERILASASTLENVVNKVRQDKKMKIAFSDSIFDSYVKLIKRNHKLTDKQVRGICFLSIPSARKDVLSKALDQDVIDKSVEGFLILNYLKDKEASIESIYKITDSDFVKSLPKYIEGSGLDALAYTLYHKNISPFDSGLRELSVLVPEIIRDFSDPKLEMSAAHALFAFASYNDCRELLDMVFHEYRDIFNKYFCTLKSEDLDKDELLSERAYSPYLEKDEYEELRSSVFRHKLKISTIEIGTSFVSNVMNPSSNNERTIDYYIEVRESLQGMISDLSRIDQDIEEQEVKRVSEMISVFKNKTGLLINGEIENRLFPKNIISLLKEISISLDKVGLIVDNKNFSSIDSAIFDLTIHLAKANGEISNLEDSMNEKASMIQQWIGDPIQNAGEIARVSTQINEAKEALESAVSRHVSEGRLFYKSILERLGTIIDDTYIVTEEIEVENDKNELIINEYSSEVIKSLESKLSRCQVELNAEREQIKAERNSLNELKNSKLKNGMSTQARSVIQRVLYNPDDCSIEEMLECCSVIYPDSVYIMDSAIKSSKETGFQNKAALWKNLMLLINSYLVGINSGNPDSEARKCFPVKVFSANESKTIDGNPALKAKRTGKYNGENFYFDKHLRFGVAHNERETLRVHFNVINEKLVIFHCGKHLDNK